MPIRVIAALIGLLGAVGRTDLQGQTAPATSVQRAAPPATIYQSERREVGSLAPDSMPRVLYVALPNSYRDSTTKRYPVVLVLDGDGVFGMASGIERLLVLGREIPEIILVGVANGIPFLETVPFRWRNFPPTPTPTHPGSGHAHELLAYLTREVVPLVDSLYRTVPGDRTLLGISRSALFVLYALYEQQGVFRHLVAASPEVIWDNKYLFRRDSTFAASKRSLPVSLYMSVGGEELARPFGTAVKEFGDLLNSRKYDGMNLLVETLPSETHNSGMGTAIAHGLKAVFSQAPAPAPAPAASQPGQEIQRLTAALAGRWSIRQTIEPRDGMPKGAEGQGTEVWRPGPGGISLIEDFDTRVGDRQLSGLGIIWWDNQARGYRVTWCGSANPRGCVVMSKLAGWEGGQFVIRDEFERDHKTIVYREVFSDLTPVSFTQIVYEGESGGELKRMTTIHAAKRD